LVIVLRGFFCSPALGVDFLLMVLATLMIVGPVIGFVSALFAEEYFVRATPHSELSVPRLAAVPGTVLAMTCYDWLLRCAV
jgi:hypothetical protein